MKHAKGLFLSLIIVALFSSFAVKPGASQSNYCAQTMSFCNYGTVNVEYADIEKIPVYQEVFDLTSGNCETTGPSLWGGSTYGWFEVRVKLAAGQNGTITVNEGGVQVMSIPTTTSQTIYRFDIEINGCLQYQIMVN